MRVLVTGGTGFIGEALLPALKSKGYELTVLTRQSSPSKAEGVDYVQDLDSLTETIDVVVNLAGASLAGKRWNAAYKDEIVTSRLELTRGLGDYFRRVDKKPSVWLNGSAIGYYGPRDDEALTETASSGEGFSAQLCRDWEASALEAAGDARVCLLRLGVVLDSGGGAYPQMAQPFTFGVANWVGDGKQWLSWVHREDVINAICFAIECDELRGPLNLTAPQPVTSRDFCTAMRGVHRTFIAIPMPGFLMRTMVGEMADELLLTGQRVFPEALASSGFSFAYPGIEDALVEIEGGP